MGKFQRSCIVKLQALLKIFCGDGRIFTLGSTKTGWRWSHRGIQYALPSAQVWANLQILDKCCPSPVLDGVSKICSLEWKSFLCLVLYVKKKWADAELIWVSVWTLFYLDQIWSKNCFALLTMVPYTLRMLPMTVSTGPVNLEKKKPKRLKWCEAVFSHDMQPSLHHNLFWIHTEDVIFFDCIVPPTCWNNIFLRQNIS